MISFSLSKIVDCVAILASLSIFVGVLIALFTLFEIRKGRQKAYEPKLFFSNMTFWLQKNANGTPCILKSDSRKSDGSSSDPFFSIDIHNIGLGAANTISIKWVYDQREIIKKFEELGKQTKLLMAIKEGYFHYIFGNEPDQGYGFIISSSEDSKEEISFLTPNQSTKTKMPEALSNYLTFIPYLELINQNNPMRIALNIDDFKVLCTYFDTGGKKHKQTINLSIQVYVYSKEFHENNYGIGTITFRK